MESRPFGTTGLQIPPIIFGTSCLGNLYQELPFETKLQTVRNMLGEVDTPVLDSAGKYGAGLALEVLGQCLRALEVPPERIVISNKLGWRRIPLQAAQPTFEPGVWVGIDHDAEQRISYPGIMNCYSQGNVLLGERYHATLVSVHDPDEYLQAGEPGARWADLLGAYRALTELKAAGEVSAVGVGSKDWRVIRRLAAEVELDWVMLACSLTPYTHEAELLDLIADLHRRGVGIINSAVFNAGFLIGGRYFNYAQPDPVADASLYEWRQTFRQICVEHEVDPAAACVQFGMQFPGVVATALNTSKPGRIARNCELVSTPVPVELWHALRRARLIAQHVPPLEKSP